MLVYNITSNNFLQYLMYYSMHVAAKMCVNRGFFTLEDLSF